MSDPFDEVVAELANAQGPVSVTAAAGCGKTEAIVRAVMQANGRQLILTHTNAGVAALRSRLRRYSVPESKYRVETIASWLLKYAAAYPTMSGLQNPKLQGNDWDKVYPAAKRLFNYGFIGDVLRASYSGVFIDEYQDCTQQQHEIALKLCEFLLVRVLGDPLQGIFGFQDDPLVDWQAVQEKFSPLPDLCVPYRWTRDSTANGELGEQLRDIRFRLLAGEPVCLSNYSEIQWLDKGQAQEQDVCLRASREREGTIVGIHRQRGDDYSSAQRMQGVYQSIEKMDCEDLMKASHQIDAFLQKGDYGSIAGLVKNFIRKGCANQQISPELESDFSAIAQGDLSYISRIMQAVIQDSNMRVFRRELLDEMRRSAEEFATGKYNSFWDAAYAARYRTRLYGRKLDKRIISRTLLIKGLEFDHAIVLDADKLQNRENFYVAITRASRSLTVLSSSDTISFSETRGG